MKKPLTSFDMRRLALEASLETGCVRRMLRGESVRRSTRVLVTEAAQRLGWLDRLPAELTPEATAV